MPEAIETQPKQWLGHPRGLATLFFTEMWERFSYYGMRALLLLYMVAPVEKGGLGFLTEKGTSIYGWYTFGVYAASIPGGWLADRFFGLYRAVLIGGVIIALGHFCMAVPSQNFFFLGLCLIVFGTGLLKPNVSSIVGTLYTKDDTRRDSGFSLFYMGINLGAFIAPLVCGYLGQKINWHWGFAAAGIGMTLGLVQYVAGKRYLVGSEAPRTEGSIAAEKRAMGDRTPAPKLTTEEWKRLAVIGILFVFATLFWAAFEQAGSSLNLFADRYTRLSLFGWNFPSSWFQSEQPLFVIIFAPIFAALWLRLGVREPSSPAKFVYGLVFVGLGFLLLVPAARIAQTHGMRVSPAWLTALYLLHTFGELCLSPVALSMVTKLSPPRMVGLMMGVWFWTLALGNKLGGYTAGFFDRLPLPTLFGAVAATTISAGIVLILLVPMIRRLMGGVH
jgi:POT family proton-dependent oligopeptide transporter